MVYEDYEKECPVHGKDCKFFTTGTGAISCMNCVAEGLNIKGNIDYDHVEKNQYRLVCKKHGSLKPSDIENFKETYICKSCSWNTLEEKMKGNIKFSEETGLYYCTKSDHGCSVFYVKSKDDTGEPIDLHLCRICVAEILTELSPRPIMRYKGSGK
jgi:hypothetical protein